MKSLRLGQLLLLFMLVFCLSAPDADAWFLRRSVRHRSTAVHSVQGQRAHSAQSASRRPFVNFFRWSFSPWYRQAHRRNRSWQRHHGNGVTPIPHGNPQHHDGVAPDGNLSRTLRKRMDPPPPDMEDAITHNARDSMDYIRRAPNLTENRHTNRTPDSTHTRPIAGPKVEYNNGIISLARYVPGGQILQAGTRTCAYNAAVGIMEILYAMRTGKTLNISEGSLLANAPKFTGMDWFTNLYKRVGTEATGLLTNQILPYWKIYRRGLGFDSAKELAQKYVKGLKDQLFKLPFKMEPKQIFMHADMVYNKARKRSYVTPSRFANRDEINAVIAWFRKHKKPVNLQFTYKSGVFHSVVMIGHNPKTGQIQIRDSLRNPNAVAEWKNLSFFNRVYGAIGVTDVDLDAKDSTSMATMS